MAATTITWSDVTALAPELADKPVEFQNAILTQVRDEVTDTKWGSMTRANIAAAWLARHLATVAPRGAGGYGPLSSISVGGVSKSFAQVSSTDGTSLSSTRYGNEYLRLIKVWFAGPRLAR
jgi:hypothetical protein